MEIAVELTQELIAEKIFPPSLAGTQGAWLEFRGVVRDEENGQAISALQYEAYPEMAVREIRRILESLALKHPCLAAKVVHRLGTIPVGDTAIYVGVASPHRGEGIALLAEFMDRLKQDVPIWKRGGIACGKADVPVGPEAGQRAPAGGKKHAGETPALPGGVPAGLSLDEALALIQGRCHPLPAVRVSLAEAFNRVLRETIRAPSDLPDNDRSTRDGYAMLQNDTSETFAVVDTLHAADWRPRQLKTGEAVRVATGTALPCENLRVVMQEHVRREGETIRIVKREDAANVRRRGEEVKARQPLMEAGPRLNAGRLALLASAGCVQPLVSPRLRVLHFTTGDEIVPPDQTPEPGRVRDSNSILIRALLRNFPCEVQQAHLPEDLERAKSSCSQYPISGADLILVSGGASVGEKDFTRLLIEWLGFDVVFSQVNLRPGRPLIFGAHGPRAAFGVPGNPLSHFVCFHLFIAAALAKLAGGEPKRFLRGRLAAGLDDALCPRETIWPALARMHDVRPLAWASSGDVTCLAEANALVRVPANCDRLEAGAEVDFLPTNEAW